MDTEQDPTEGMTQTQRRAVHLATGHKRVDTVVRMILDSDAAELLRSAHVNEGALETYLIVQGYLKLLERHPGFPDELDAAEEPREVTPEATPQEATPQEGA